MNSKRDILDKWYREGLVQKNVKHYKNANWEEVISMVYADLCEKPEELIQQLDESGDYKFYISRMVSNQIKSKYSPYRWQNRHHKISTDIEPYLDTIPDKEAQNVLNYLEENLQGEDLMMLDMIVNYTYINGGRVRPQAEIMERFKCTRYAAGNKFDVWKEKIKKVLL